MNTFSGAIVNKDGKIEFRFSVTAMTKREATAKASEILNAWRKLKKDNEYFYDWAYDY